MFHYNHKPIRSWSKLNHPIIRERQKYPLSSPKLLLMSKALLSFVFSNNPDCEISSLLDGKLAGGELPPVLWRWPVGLLSQKEKEKNSIFIYNKSILFISLSLVIL